MQQHHTLVFYVGEDEAVLQSHLKWPDFKKDMFRVWPKAHLNPQKLEVERGHHGNIIKGLEQ